MRRSRTSSRASRNWLVLIGILVFRYKWHHLTPQKEFKVQLGAYDQMFDIKREINNLSREVQYRKQKLGSSFPVSVLAYLATSLLSL